MKKTICLLLSVCMLLCLAACQGTAGRPLGKGSTVSTESQDSSGNSAPTETPNDQNGEEPYEISVLTLEKALITYYEWADDLPQALVRSEHSCVTLGQEDAKAFPEMAEVLS